MSHWRWVLTHVMRRLWFRATLIGMLGVAAAMLAAVVDNYIPWQMPWNIGAEAVDSILTIIASSMLAVTTFSLNVMTSAYGSAANNGHAARHETPEGGSGHPERPLDLPRLVPVRHCRHRRPEDGGLWRARACRSVYRNHRRDRADRHLALALDRLPDPFRSGRRDDETGRGSNARSDRSAPRSARTRRRAAFRSGERDSEISRRRRLAGHRLCRTYRRTGLVTMVRRGRRGAVSDDQSRRLCLCRHDACMVQGEGGRRQRRGDGGNRAQGFLHRRSAQL